VSSAVPTRRRSVQVPLGHTRSPDGAGQLSTRTICVSWFRAKVELLLEFAPRRPVTTGLGRCDRGPPDPGVAGGGQFSSVMCGQAAVDAAGNEMGNASAGDAVLCQPTPPTASPYTPTWLNRRDDSAAEGYPEGLSRTFVDSAARDRFQGCHGRLGKACNGVKGSWSSSDTSQSYSQST
jgi:hypothetical protein